MQRNDDKVDIVIYTTPEKLEHKKGADGYFTYYWHLFRPPKNFKVGDRVYFAVKGQVVGSFKCTEFNSEKDNRETIVWNMDSWRDVDPILTKRFQNFKYRWW